MKSRYPWRGKIVAKVRLNPAPGEILTKGEKAFIRKLSVTPEQAVKAVQGVVNQVPMGADWLGKQGEWKVPLLYKGPSSPRLGSMARTAPFSRTGKLLRMPPCSGNKGKV